MNILFDTNIIAEYFEHRAQYGFVRPILQAVRDGQHKGFITQGTVYTLTYLAERALKRSGRLSTSMISRNPPMMVWNY